MKLKDFTSVFFIRDLTVDVLTDRYRYGGRWIKNAQFKDLCEFRGCEISYIWLSLDKNVLNIELIGGSVLENETNI